jgi:hypothetical protein
MQKAEMQELFGLQKEGVRMAQDKGCYGCEERKAGRHSTCEKYKEWKEEHDARQAEIRMRRDKERRADNTIITLKENAKKRRGDR